MAATTQEAKKSFTDTMLSKSELSDFQFVKNRIIELQDVRGDHYGVDLDSLWAEADREYVPHRLGTKGKRVVATDETKGWRGQLVELNTKDWRSDISQSNAYIKIGVALATLIDQNPSGVLTPLGKKYESTTLLMKQLYDRSWEVARSKGQLKLFVHNLAKYGFAAARTFPLLVKRKVKVMKIYDPDNPSKNEYETKEVTEYNDIFRENLDPRNVWIDDMARPNNTLSVRDWLWRKVYSMDVAEEEFGKYKNWKYVQSGGTTTETIGQATKGKTKTVRDKNLLEVYFYENRIKDLFYVIANGVPVIIEPLPIADTEGVKKLSLWYTYWTLRHAESIYGIGIYEALRYEQAILDRFRNMTIDQLTMSIYKMFFYQGTQSLTDTGDIEIVPGKGKQVLDPKNINWLDVPGPGNEAWVGLDYFRKGLDEVSGITEPLMGEVTGKTAFEIAQAKEAALKRLKTPFDNILDALNEEGRITISLIQMLYSIPETYAVSDPQLIEAYLNEIGSDPELYERDENGSFTAKVFREFPIDLEEDEKGNLIETDETKFFRVKPKYLKWEGLINIKAQSLLTPSKQVDKALELEMWNMLIPLFAQPPELYLKAAKAIAKLYEKDPEDIIPDLWLNPPPPEEQPLFIDENQPPQGAQISGAQGQRAQKMVASPQAPPGKNTLTGSVANRMKTPYR